MNARWALSALQWQLHIAVLCYRADRPNALCIYSQYRFTQRVVVYLSTKVVTVLFGCYVAGAPLSLSVSLCLYASLCLSVSFSVSLSVSLSVCLSLSLYDTHPSTSIYIIQTEPVLTIVLKHKSFLAYPPERKKKKRKKRIGKQFARSLYRHSKSLHSRDNKLSMFSQFSSVEFFQWSEIPFAYICPQCPSQWGQESDCVHLPLFFRQFG